MISLIADPGPHTVQVHVGLNATPAPARSSARSFSQRVRSRLAATNGGALVEVALTMPVVLLIMTGIFTFSTALYQQLALAQAVGTGGRVVAVDRGDTDPCKTVAAAVAAAAPTLTKANLRITLVLGGVSTGPSATPSCAGSNGAPNPNLTTGGTAQVTVTYPCSLAVYGHNYGSCTLSSQITEVVQ
jgi:Flp pilus assembly protein TadG